CALRRGPGVLSPPQSRGQPAGRTLTRALGADRACQACISGSNRRVEQNQREEVALRVAAADLLDALARGREALDHARVILRAPGDHRLAEVAPEIRVDPS